MWIMMEDREEKFGASPSSAAVISRKKVYEISLVILH